MKREIVKPRARVPLKRDVRVLDLFSGARGWTAPFEPTDHSTFSIDIDSSFKADAHLDIGDVATVLHAVPWRPDYIFASPPCNSFSTMTMGRMWTHDGEPKHRLAVEGRRLVLATLRIVSVLQPRFGWVIENPRARLRTLDLLQGVPVTTISQCQ
jgi:site-specific DNA-cytosine methylase